MTRLEMVLEGESLGATKVMRAANVALRLLRAVEKSHTKKPPAIEWQVDILTGFRHAIIVLRVDSQKDPESAMMWDTAQTAIAQMRRNAKVSQGEVTHDKNP